MLATIHDLWVHYGMVEAIKDVSIEIDRGEIVAIIGPNGAGKTTLLRTISGLKRSSKGQILFEGKRLDRYPPRGIVKMGIAHVPEGRQLFPFMSVGDNLALGAFLRTDRAEIDKDLERCFRHFPILKERLRQQAGSLSGGQQQMLAVARALMAKPRLLLMDEPSLGLAPKMVAEVGRIVHDINEEGVSIVLVEQNARMALSVAHRGYVLQTGQIVLSGATGELMGHDDVKRAYLGG